jgi:hypothetical protein
MLRSLREKGESKRLGPRHVPTGTGTECSTTLKNQVRVTPSFTLIVLVKWLSKSQRREVLPAPFPPQKSSL